MERCWCQNREEPMRRPKNKILNKIRHRAIQHALKRGHPCKILRKCISSHLDNGYVSIELPKSKEG